jgi:hypothetical protein
VNYGAMLTFDAATHTYSLPDGSRVPSVTEILRATGVSVDFDRISRESASARLAIEMKRELGTALHADAHAYDDNDLDWSTVDARVKPYLEAWVTFRENQCLTPLRRERRLYHPALRYAGTLDGIFLTSAGMRVLVDIKTGDPEDSGCRYQTAAYQAAYELDHDSEPPIDARWGVQLTPGRQVPYRVTPYGDWKDAQVWRAIVTTFYARRRAA